MNDDDPLADLSPDSPPPPELRAATLRHLRARGALDDRRSGPRRAVARALGMAAVLLLAFWGGRATATDGPDGIPALEDAWVVLLYETAASHTAGLSDADVVRAYAAWARTTGAAGDLVLAEQLGAPSAWVGPTAGAAAEPSGLFVVRAPDLAGAVALVEGSPHPRFGGGALVRPVLSGPPGATAGR